MLSAKTWMTGAVVVAGVCTVGLADVTREEVEVRREATTIERDAARTGEAGAIRDNNVNLIRERETTTRTTTTTDRTYGTTYHDRRTANAGGYTDEPVFKRVWVGNRMVTHHLMYPAPYSLTGAADYVSQEPVLKRVWVGNRMVTHHLNPPGR